MSTKRIAAAVVGLVAVFLVAAGAVGADKRAPTGACTISVYGVSPTCSILTRDSCYALATKVGGTADWKEGGSCK